MMFNKLYNSLIDNSSNVAFCINETFYSYEELFAVVGKIRALIQANIADDEQIIGLVANNDIETYASILALWFEGKAYLPLLRNNPIQRTKTIAYQANIQTILSSDSNENIENIHYLNSKDVEKYNPIFKEPENIPDKLFAYILFTSGSTALPKGVPISRGNLHAFVDAFEALDVNITKEDKCLQMFDLTFDMSVVAFLMPLLHGASVYTLPITKAKYAYVVKLLHEKKLTIAVMVPSVINYLSSYFDEIHCPSLRYNLFAGEALMKNTLFEWKKCVPNARIDNACGPTETTIICSYYTIPSSPQFALSHNDLLSIGKPMKGTKMIVADENKQILAQGKEGEICIAGNQVFNAYLHEDKKNNTVFFEQDGVRYYSSGDMAFFDEQGYFFFTGRKDFQIKIDGYRIDLLEIEHHIRNITNHNYPISVLSYIHNEQNLAIGVVIESNPIDTEFITNKLKLVLPKYMLPSRFIFVEKMPLNNNGKVDKHALKWMLETHLN